MHLSQFASNLRCAHCSQLCRTTEWPINGDRIPFYSQREPARFQVAVNCPHCGKASYVVWDDDPGPIQPLFGSSAIEPIESMATVPQVTAAASGIRPDLATRRDAPDIAHNRLVYSMSTPDDKLFDGKQIGLELAQIEENRRGRFHAARIDATVAGRVPPPIPPDRDFQNAAVLDLAEKHDLHMGEIRYLAKSTKQLTKRQLRARSERRFSLLVTVAASSAFVGVLYYSWWSWWTIPLSLIAALVASVAGSVASAALDSAGS